MNMKGLKRLIRHLYYGKIQLRRRFPPGAMKAIERGIEGSEKLHKGEIQFVIEASLDPLLILRGVSARDRAVDVFSNLRLWDTEENTGVLIYLLLADRDIEILADRGINRVTEQKEWESICSGMEELFRAGQFEKGVIQGIEKITEILERHFPHNGDDINELHNRPIEI